jgi:hypothetical protein
MRMNSHPLGKCQLLCIQNGVLCWGVRSLQAPPKTFVLQRCRSNLANERGSSHNQPIEFQGAWQGLKDRLNAGPADRRLMFNNIVQ